MGRVCGVTGAAISYWMKKLGVESTWFKDRARFAMGSDGYEEWTSVHDGEKLRVYVHQVFAIAHGADPYEIFGGDQQVHHKNGIKWDTREDNIEVLGLVEHAVLSAEEQWGDKPWRNKELMETALKRHTNADLADEWNCSTRTISDWRGRHDLPPGKPGPRPSNKGGAS